MIVALLRFGTMSAASFEHHTVRHTQVISCHAVWTDNSGTDRRPSRAVVTSHGLPWSQMLGFTSVDPVTHAGATLLGLVPSSFVYVYAGAVGNQVASGGVSVMDYVAYGIGLLATVLVTMKVVKVAQTALDDAVESE